MGKIIDFLKKWDCVILFFVGAIIASVFHFATSIQVCALPVLVCSFLGEALLAVWRIERPNFVRFICTISGALSVQVCVIM